MYLQWHLRVQLKLGYLLSPGQPFVRFGVQEVVKHSALGVGKRYGMGYIYNSNPKPGIQQPCSQATPIFQSYKV